MQYLHAAVFLAAPRGYDEDGIPSYPTARLGDFGLALITGEEDSNNPAKFKGIGTPGYKAPVGVATGLPLLFMPMLTLLQGAKNP